LSLHDRIKALAEDLVLRETAHADAIERARHKARELHERVDSAVELFNQTLEGSAPYLRVDVSPTRVDDKHLHAIEFNLERGRHRAVVTVKSKGVVTLVGPFRRGKKEGPCLSFPIEQHDDIEDALGDFLERFLQAAASP
jgi:hypothetical protein